MKSETIQSLLEAAKELADKSKQNILEEAEKLALAARHLTKAATDVHQLAEKFTDPPSSQS